MTEIDSKSTARKSIWNFLNSINLSCTCACVQCAQWTLFWYTLFNVDQNELPFVISFFIFYWFNLIARFFFTSQPLVLCSFFFLFCSFARNSGHIRYTFFTAWLSKRRLIVDRQLFLIAVVVIVVVRNTLCAFNWKIDFGSFGLAYKLHLDTFIQYIYTSSTNFTALTCSIKTRRHIKFSCFLRCHSFSRFLVLFAVFSFVCLFVSEADSPENRHHEIQNHFMEFLPLRSSIKKRRKNFVSQWNQTNVHKFKLYICAYFVFRL